MATTRATKKKTTKKKATKKKTTKKAKTKAATKGTKKKVAKKKATKKKASSRSTKASTKKKATSKKSSTKKATSKKKTAAKKKTTKKAATKKKAAPKKARAAKAAPKSRRDKPAKRSASPAKRRPPTKRAVAAPSETPRRKTGRKAPPSFGPPAGGKRTEARGKLSGRSGRSGELRAGDESKVGLFTPPKPPAKKRKTRKKKANKQAYDPAYRKMRKWTIKTLAPIINDPEHVRNRIHSELEGELIAEELLQYLQLLEDDIPKWRERKMNKNKQGRPKKGTKKVAEKPAPVKDPSKTLAAAASGKILPKRSNGAETPPKLFSPPKPKKAPPKFSLPKRAN